MLNPSAYSVAKVMRCLLLVAVLLSPSGCERSGETQAPPELPDGWAVAEPADAGFDASALTELTRSIEEGEFPNTHAVLIEYDGRLVYEQYFEGTDERFSALPWGTPIGHRTMNRDDLHDLQSISKSVMSAVLGIALDNHFEQAVNKPIVSYFPSRPADPGWQTVTLHHALTMTAGIEWNEMTVPYTDETSDSGRLYQVEDPVASVLARSLRNAPGEAWYYNSGLSEVLAGIVYQITGQTLDAYADEVLFKPLGITNYEWLGEPSWNPAMPSAAGGLRMRARDLAKIGSVYLHNGRWNGRQIVPQEWVKRSMERHVDAIATVWSDGGTYGYGYQWWHASYPQGYTVVEAVGNGNQRVFVIPEERIVVTVFAGEYNKFDGRREPILHWIMGAR